MASLLTDELLQDLIAVGEVDVLVGLPTQNHGQTVGSVVRAVVAAFSGPLMRQRTALLNVDGGSTDGTRDSIRNSVPPAELVSTSYALRTIHRISAPYHGIAGRGSALRILLTSAELLRARAVLVLDPSAECLALDDIVAFVHAVLRGEADYVKPALPRAYADGPLVTQLVRPLFRAAFGQRLLEPIDTQFACSRRFVSDVLTAHFWSSTHAETTIDAFLTAHALTTQARLAQVATAARARVGDERRPSVAEVFRQVVGSVLACLIESFPRWTQIKGSQPLAVHGSMPAARSPPRFDTDAFAAAFRRGVDALAPLLETVLDAAVLEQLLVLARAPRLVLDEALWAQTVFQCVEAAIRGTAPPDRLAQMLEPLYLGRVATFLDREPETRASDPFEPLAAAFEQEKLALLARLENEEK